MKEDMTSS